MGKPYENAPLVTVVTEVRYPALPSGSLRAAGAALRSSLKSVLPIADTVVHTNFELGPQPEVQRRRFPRYKSRDSTTAMVVHDEGLTVETTAYRGFEVFISTVERLVEIVNRSLEPVGITRIGLRYVDEVRLPNVTELPGDWRGYIAPELLAAVDESFLPKGIRAEAWQGLVRYNTGPGRVLILRYGPALGHATDPNADGARRRKMPPPGPFFLLDSDSVWSADEDIPEFSTKFAIDTLHHLHDPVSSIFDAACTDALRSTFGQRLEE